MVATKQTRPKAVKAAVVAGAWGMGGGMGGGVGLGSGSHHQDGDEEEDRADSRPNLKQPGQSSPRLMFCRELDRLMALFERQSIASISRDDRLIFAPQ